MLGSFFGLVTVYGSVLLLNEYSRAYACVGPHEWIRERNEILPQIIDRHMFVVFARKYNLSYSRSGKALSSKAHLKRFTRLLQSLPPAPSRVELSWSRPWQMRSCRSAVTVRGSQLRSR